MRRLLALSTLLFFVGLLCLTQQPSRAFWQSRDSNYNISTSSGSAYVGPGDIVAFNNYYALRGYNTAFASRVANICDVATGLVCADAIWSGSVLTIPTISGLVCGVGINCNVKILYDQIGSCDIQQNTNAQRPAFTINAQGSFPGLTFTSAGLSNMSCSSTITVTQPFGMTLVGTRTANVTALQAVLEDTGGSIQFGFSNTAANAYLFAGAAIRNASAADNSIHSIQARANGASSELYIEGALTPLASPGTSGFSGTGPALAAGLAFDGVFFETGVIVTYSGANATAVTTNQRNYYGF